MSDDLRERISKALFLAATDTDADVDDVWIQGDLSRFTEAVVTLLERKHPAGRCGDPNCGGDW